MKHSFQSTRVLLLIQNCDYFKLTSTRVNRLTSYLKITKGSPHNLSEREGEPNGSLVHKAGEVGLVCNEAVSRQLE